MDYLTVINILANAMSGIFANMRAEKARVQAESYLKAKYRLTTEEVNVGHTMRLIETAYPDAWERTLFRLLKRVLAARRLSVELAEASADVYVMTSVLRHGPRKLDHQGNVRSASYSYLKSLWDTQTHESLQDLARGRGGEVTLQIVQKELLQWCADEGLDVRRG